MSEEAEVRDEKGRFVKGMIPWNKKERVQIICEGCGKPFFVQQYRVNAKYCSPTCRRKRVLVKCLNCGKTFYIKLSVYHKYKNHFCSQECYFSMMDTVMTDETKGKLRVARLSQRFPNRETSIERRMQKELKNRGIRFETHVSLDVCIPDIIIFDQRLAIFCDGDYWHNRKEAKERDAFQNRFLFMHGWYPLRFWEHEINGDVEDCVNNIIKNMTLKARFISRHAIVLGRPVIGEGCWIGHWTMLDGINAELIIGERCSISSGSALLTHDNSYFVASEGQIPKKNGPVYISDNCFVGENAIILPDVHIQHNSIVGAGAVVTHNVDPYSIVAGNPAKKIGEVKTK